MDDFTSGVGAICESKRVNLSNINGMLDGIRVGAPRSVKDLIGAPSYCESGVVFGSSIVSADGAKLASRECRGRQFIDPGPAFGTIS